MTSSWSVCQNMQDLVIREKRERERVGERKREREAEGEREAETGRERERERKRTIKANKGHEKAIKVIN